MNDIKLCKDCGINPVKPQRNAKRPFCRCDECHKIFKRNEMRRLREKKKEQTQEDVIAGLKRCTKCKKLKPYSAFSENKNKINKELNKLCDKCLSAIYLSQNKFNQDMTPEWWRARAYNANTVARSREARKAGELLVDYPLEKLAWICKPNDLIEMYISQNKQCAYCGCILNKTNLGVEHILPLSRGGKHVLDNICLSCKDCNNLKGTRTGGEFLTFLKAYTARLSNRFKE